jgi:hypothetical protein
MTHFATEDWADFARGVVSPERKAAMESHLQEGCRRCSEVARMWQVVRSAAQRQSGLEPPDSAVRMAKLSYDQAPFVKPPKPALADLLFDSFRAPLAAGVRSAASAVPRQMLYSAGTHRIDVRLEPKLDSDRVAVAGQVLDSAQPAKNLEGLPVRLFAGRKVLAASTTTRFGEFQFDAVKSEQLELRVGLASGGEVSASLVPSDVAADSRGIQYEDSVQERKKSEKSNKSTRKKG